MRFWFIFLTILPVFACNTGNKIHFKPDYSPGPAALVYKTKADYRDKVPVILSEDKTRVVSYPHPSDLKTDSGYIIPTDLAEGYLLDNKGITANVAFLKLNYSEYAALEFVPSLEELYALILDKDPLTELCSCGNRKSFKDMTAQLNDLIKKGELRKVCKVER